MKINPDLIESEYNITTGSSPVKTGRRVEGKEEYVIKVNCGNMPNNATKNITLPISLANVTVTKKIELFGQSPQNEFPIMQTGITWFISGGNVLSITTTSDRSRFTCFTEIYFTYK